MRYFMNKETIADCINNMNDFTDQMAKLSEFLSESDNKQISDISPILDEYILEIRTDCYMLSYTTGLENNNEISLRFDKNNDITFNNVVLADIEVL